MQCAERDERTQSYHQWKFVECKNKGHVLCNHVDPCVNWPISLLPTGNYWNAASFPNPSSYLHFSTFQGETSADISFYFKTLTPRGVFLENLGNTDFIKLELKCEYQFFVQSNGPVSLPRLVLTHFLSLHGVQQGRFSWPKNKQGVPVLNVNEQVHTDS